MTHMPSPSSTRPKVLCGEALCSSALCGREHCHLVCVPVPSQLRLAVVGALGPMSHLLPSEKLEEQLPRLLPGVLALYRKHAETCHVSKVWSEHRRSGSVVAGDRPALSPLGLTRCPLSHSLPSPPNSGSRSRARAGASTETDSPSAPQSLGQILEAAVSVGSRTLDVQLDMLLAALHAQVGGGGWGVLAAACRGANMLVGWG